MNDILCDSNQSIARWSSSKTLQLLKWFSLSQKGGIWKSPKNRKRFKNSIAKRPFFIIRLSLWCPSSISVGSLRARTRGNSTLVISKGSSTLPTKPFSHLKTQRKTQYKFNYQLCTNFAVALRQWRTDALFQKFQLISVFISSTADFVQTYQKHIFNQVKLSFGYVCHNHLIPIMWKFCHFLNSDTQHFCLIQAKQPKLYSLKTFRDRRRLCRKETFPAILEKISTSPCLRMSSKVIWYLFSKSTTWWLPSGWLEKSWPKNHLVT